MEAKRRYGLVILNYMVTSNHIHLLVVDDGNRDVIPRSIQLVAGRTAWEYNQRKRRKGAFWEDRYHATAIETGEHLLQCMVYIDLNMVRAGIVNHPSEWPFSGYEEIQEPRRKCVLIGYERLKELAGIDIYSQFQAVHREWVNATLGQGRSVYDSKWTRSIAVGNMQFIGKVREELGIRATGRDIIRSGTSYELREPGVSYSYDFGLENSTLSPDNTYFWNFYS